MRRLSLEANHQTDKLMVGLLTYANLAWSNLSAFPGNSQWQNAQVLRAYSCGAVADLHRLPKHQECNLYKGKRAERQTHFGRAPHRTNYFKHKLISWSILRP